MARIISERVEIVLTEAEWNVLEELVEFIGAKTGDELVVYSPEYNKWYAADDVLKAVQKAREKGKKV